MALAPVPSAQSPIRSAIRSLAQPEQGRPAAADPLPKTLESLHGIPIPKEVDTFNPGVIHFEESASPESPRRTAPPEFIPKQGSPSPLFDLVRTVLKTLLVDTRLPSPSGRSNRAWKAEDRSKPVPETPRACPLLKRLKRGSQKKRPERPDNARRSPRFEKD